MRKILSVLLTMLLLFTLSTAVMADEAAPVEIYTPEDLQKMAEDPDGSFILMEDLDMTGIPWKALDFSGTLDGNGHAILNLTLTEMGDTKPNSCDGNRKLYETAYFGLFGALTDAEVKNLKLLNVRALVDIDEPCFIGGLAGYAENAIITDCTIVGNLELGSVFYPRRICADNVVRYVRAMQASDAYASMETLCKIASGKAEAMEFHVTAASPFCGIPLQELSLKSNLLVGCISRGSKLIIPRGSDTIEVGDSVIVVTTHSGLRSLDDIFAQKK